MRMTLSRILLAGSIALLFSACSSTPKYESSDYGIESDPQYGVTDPNKIRHLIANPAVKDLWDQAEAARIAGDYDTAELKLERALRIAPEDAVMWSRLAEVHLSKGNSNQAENLAAKSNAMTMDKPTLYYRNWLIIAKARSLRGDDIGAQEAEYTASSFRP